MTVTECIKTLMERHGVSQRDLAERLGYTGQGCISKPLSRNNGMGMRVDTLIKWVEELGYQVIIQSPEDESDDLTLDGENEL